MAYTVVPAAVDALIRLVDNHFANTDSDVQVMDGPSVEDVGQDVVAIGISADESGMDADFNPAGMGGQEMETFDMVNMVRSWTGDSDLSARRVRAFELFEQVAGVIKADPKLNATVARARIVAVTYQPSRIPEGAIATVMFRVRIWAFTS